MKKLNRDKFAELYRKNKALKVFEKYVLNLQLEKIDLENENKKLKRELEVLKAENYLLKKENKKGFLQKIFKIA